MDKSEDVTKVRQVKSLLELIQQLHVEPAASAATSGSGATAAHVDNPYIQHWSRYQAANLAATRAVARPPTRGTSISPWLFVVATLLNTTIAAVLGVLITLSVVRQEPQREAELARSSSLSADARRADPRHSMMTAEAVPGTVTSGPVEVQPIGTRERPLRLEALKPARLPLRIQPEDAAGESYILVLSGVPAKASILGAERIGADSWLLRPQAITNLQITMPEWSMATMEVGVELRRTNGALAGRTTAWLSVPPPATLQGASEASLDQSTLLQRGDQLLGRGDILAARALYERAAELGSAQAALALGSTYDPSRLWSLGVFGMVGNKEKARQWYARADQLGHAAAKERLRALAN